MTISMAMAKFIGNFINNKQQTINHKCIAKKKRNG